MNCTIHHSEPHTTFDGYQATYCTLMEAVTGRLAASFQIVFLPDGGQCYRSMDRESYELRLTFDEIARLAMDEETKRREHRPVRPKRQKPVRGGYRGRRRSYNVPVVPRKSVSAARMHLVRKLNQRWADGQAVTS